MILYCVTYHDTRQLRRQWYSTELSARVFASGLSGAYIPGTLSIEKVVVPMRPKQRLIDFLNAL